MGEPRPVPQPQLQEDFQRHLEQIERHNWEDKIFYPPRDIRTWMNTKSPGETATNVVRLVSFFYNSGDGFPKITADQCTDYLLVLAALLHPEVNCGHLIHIFVQYTLSDESLFYDPTSLYDSIVQELTDERPLLPSNFTQYDYKAVTGAFDKVRWAFCPARLTLHMNTTFTSGPWILPFFYGEVINKKGGTANVRHYKIQDDLVESKDLKKALASSRHKDPTKGWCYEFAVKSYATGWDDIYKLESEAFRAVRSHEGVVKYLGEYHFRECGAASPTHNILLEYGQQDLDEYIADTYPPVLNNEIIAFWEDLFKVAATLKRLHQFQYKSEDGRTKHYKGWHGDIKPDNILRVRGEFKLADFGFTKFEKDVVGKTSTFILGGTRTYGAPECDPQRSKTTTPQLQTIDTWSFGCVLSAVATWVILGSQAYDNYRQVRMLEIAELRQRVEDGKGGSAPSGDDAFHDGTQVLPSVLHWHDFLRNSSRKADTISHRVLDLVEEKMLLTNPNRRLSFEMLCEKLEEIIILAKNDQKRFTEKGQLKVIAPDTLEALLHLDKRAPSTATPIAEVNTAQIAGQGSGSLLPNGRSQLRPGSERVRKSERLEKVVIGKTANRETAISTDLVGLGIVSEGQEICDSPEQSERLFEAFPPAKNSQYPPDSIGKWKGIDIPNINVSPYYPAVTHTGGFLPAFVDSSSTPQKGTQRPFKPPKLPINTTNIPSFSFTDGTQGTESQLPNDTVNVKGKEITRQSGDFGEDEEYSDIKQGHNFHTPATPPEVCKVPERQMTTETPHSVSPSSVLPPTPQISPETALEPDGAKLPVVEIPRAHASLSYAIFEEHARLDKLWGDKKGAFSSLMGRIPEDPWLKNFITNRDIVFVVDNAFTMKEHWAVVTEVLITLAMKIGPLDKDGLDLWYAIGSQHNLQEIKGWGIPKTFKSSMQNAGEEINHMYKTNMTESLARIFDTYTDTRKKMTLIVLTDGLWEGCANEDDVEKLIASFITKLNPKLKKWESRWFSIQFVSFGGNLRALGRLQKLDDNMPIDEDVIDSKPWSYPDVNKLILGSMTDGDDKEDPPSPSPSPLPRPVTNASLHMLHSAPERRSSRRKRLSTTFGSFLK